MKRRLIILSRLFSDTIPSLKLEPTMRRRGGLTVTAHTPISRTKRSRHRKLSLIRTFYASLTAATPKRLELAALAAILFGGAILLAMSMCSSSNAINSSATRNKGSLRQLSAQVRDLSTVQGLIIHTHLGDIRIHFTPKLAGESSIKYIMDVVQAVSGKRNNVCQKCIFYRVEKQQLLEGIIADESVPENKVLGPCPDPNYIPPKKCPNNGPDCGCHGPIMTKGMVAWSHHTGNGGGPDFIINTNEKPVDYWGGHHTVWGEIRDDISLKVVESAEELPIDVQRTIQTGMIMLEEEIEFSFELF